MLIEMIETLHADDTKTKEEVKRADKFLSHLRDYYLTQVRGSEWVGRTVMYKGAECKVKSIEVIWGKPFAHMRCYERNGGPNNSVDICDLCVAISTLERIYGEGEDSANKVSPLGDLSL